MIRYLLPLFLFSAAWGETPAQRVKIEVSVLTHFAHDRGDVPSAVFFHGKQYSLAEAAAAILPELGWNEPAQRPELALAWVKEVDLVGLSSAKEPTVHILSDGNVVVDAWVHEPTGNHPPRVGHHRYTFTPAAHEKSEFLP